jgi:hypothetical protein
MMVLKKIKIIAIILISCIQNTNCQDLDSIISLNDYILISIELDEDFCYGIAMVENDYNNIYNHNGPEMDIFEKNFNDFSKEILSELNSYFILINSLQDSFSLSLINYSNYDSIKSITMKIEFLKKKHFEMRYMHFIEGYRVLMSCKKCHPDERIYWWSDELFSDELRNDVITIDLKKICY